MKKPLAKTALIVSGLIVAIATGVAIVQRPGNAGQTQGGNLGNRIPPEVMTGRDAHFASAEQIAAKVREARRKGDLNQAEAACREAITRFQGDPYAKTLTQTLGDILIEKGEYRQALQCFPEAQSPQPSPHLSVALCYARMGDLANAQRFYSDATLLENIGTDARGGLPGTGNIKTLEASILLSRAMGHRETGENEEALADFNRAGQLSRANGLIAYFHARTLATLKRYDEAETQYRIAAANARGPFQEDARRKAANYEAYRNTQHIREQLQKSGTTGDLSTGAITRGQ